MATALDKTTASRLFHPTSRAKQAGRLNPLEPTGALDPYSSPELEAIRSLYFRPGPYVSVNVTVHPGTGPAAGSINARWAAIDLELQRRRTSPLVIEEIAQRVLGKPPAWAASLSVLAASDGTVVAGHGPTPFFADMVTVDTLPYAVPLLTWSQRRGPHLLMTDAGYTVTVDEANPGNGDGTQSAADRAIDHVFINSLEQRWTQRPVTRLVLLGQPAATRPVAEMIAAGTDRRFQVVSETRLVDADKLISSRTQMSTEAGGTAVATVTHQAVANLPGIDGDSEAVATVLNRLSRGDIDVLVIPPDDTLDQRRVWLGDNAADLSLHGQRGYEHQGRLVDAAIRAAMVGGVSVVVQTDGDLNPRFAA